MNVSRQADFLSGVYMRWLELKVPPPLVAVVIGFAMRESSFVLPPLVGPHVIHVLALATVAVAAAGFDIAGMISFRKAKTTVNPMKPDIASSLVTSGIYQITRNPMYVGLTLWLVAWADYLSSPATLIGPVLFFLYIDRMQIRPEERVLAAKFGADYQAYARRVRRWL